MNPSSLAWILLCLHAGRAAALVLPLRDEAIRPPSELRTSSYVAHRLLGHKRAPQFSWVPPGGSEDLNWKRAPNGLGKSGFYGDVFNHGFGAFSPVKRGRQSSERRPEMTANGLHDDVFTAGMGIFDTVKRRPEMTANGFYDDVFRGDLGHFDTMKRRPEMTANGFYDDVFRGGMGHFDTMKRRPEMTANGFYGDVFKGGMGHFDTMKRTLEGEQPRQSSENSGGESNTKRRADDETMSTKGLRSELVPRSVEEFITMR